LSTIQLRPYQIDAHNATFNAWDQGIEKFLLSMPTGTGKTRVGSAIAADWIKGRHKDYGRPERVLWLAHRDELIPQAATALQQATGIEPVIEKAEQTAFTEGLLHPEYRIVVASIQTLYKKHRRERFSAAEFGGVILDECHHVVADSYLEVLGHFVNSKILGLTATTDRTDEISLGKFFQDAHHYDILDAMKDGWLCPIIQEIVEVENLDFSGCSTTASGDLSPTDIERIITEEKPLHAIVSGAVQCAGDRPTIVFAPTVNAARAIAAIIPRYTNRGAVSICGKDKQEERDDAIRLYNSGDVQFLVNVAVLTEGFDAPQTSCIVIARPTKSRLVYAQQIGRGLRGGPKCPVPGKTDCLVVDLVGCTGRHKLVHAADVLGGKYDAEVVEEANRRLMERRGSMDADVLSELLKAAEKAEELKAAKRRMILAEAKLKRREVDPFVLFNVPDHKLPGWFEAKPPTEQQLKILEENGVKTKGVSGSEAKQLCDEIFRRRDQGTCTFKQARRLAAFGYATDVSFDEARHILDELAKRGWKHSKEEIIRHAQQKSAAEFARLVERTVKAEVLRGPRGGFAGLRCDLGIGEEVVKGKEKARKLWAALKKKGGVNLVAGE